MTEQNTPPETVADLIRKWRSRREFAEAVGETLDNVHKWAQSGRIPSWKQAAVLEAARKRQVPVDAEWMVALHAERGAA